MRGSRTVSLGDAAVHACLVLAAQCAGRPVRAVEGLAGALHPRQEAFTAEHGLQCGFRTPGLLMTPAGELVAAPDRDEPGLTDVLAGSPSRRTGYVSIRRAAPRAAAALRETG